MKISVFALGRTGLPLSLVCADSGFEVIGIDINEELVDQIKNGEIPFDKKIDQITPAPQIGKLQRLHSTCYHFLGLIVCSCLSCRFHRLPPPDRSIE